MTDKSYLGGHGLDVRPHELAYMVPRINLPLSYRQGWKNHRPHLQELPLYSLWHLGEQRRTFPFSPTSCQRKQREELN